MKNYKIYVSKFGTNTKKSFKFLINYKKTKIDKLYDFIINTLRSNDTPLYTKYSIKTKSTENMYKFIYNKTPEVAREDDEYAIRNTIIIFGLVTIPIQTAMITKN